MALNGSWQQQVLCTATADTIADGITVCEPIPQALDDLQGLVDDVLLVSDWHPLQAMQLAQRHTGLLLEPAGAAGLAGVWAHWARWARWAHRARWAGGSVATVLCGSDFKAEHLRDILRSP